MGRISGADAKIGLKKSPIFGIELPLGANDAVCHEGFDWDNTSETIEPASLGCGLAMKQDVIKGALSTTVNLPTDLKFDGVSQTILQMLMGGEETPSEQTSGQGDYLHRFIYDASRPHAVIGAQATDGDTVVFPASFATGISLSVDSYPNKVSLVADFIANDRKKDSAINNFAQLENLTELPSNIVIAQRDTTLRINERDGAALAAGDNVAHSGITLNLTRAMENTNDADGVGAGTRPKSVGQFEGTLDVTFSGLEDLDYFTAFDDDVIHKCSLVIEGVQIGTGLNESFSVFLPAIKLNSEPDYSLSDAGENPMSLSFDILGAVVVPSGMASQLPYFETINSRSAAY